MTNSIALHTCNLGGSVRTGTNPFTGEPVEFPIDDGLNHSELSAVRAILGEYSAAGPDPDGCYKIVFTKNSYVNVCAGDLDASIPCVSIKLEIEGPATHDILRFAHRLALDGNMSVGSIVDPDVVALVAEPRDPKVRRRWPTSPVLASNDEFIKWVQENLGIGIADSGEYPS